MNAAPQVLFVDDDLETSRSISRALERNGAVCSWLFSTDEHEARQLIERSHPEVCIVDLSLGTAGPVGGLSLIPKLLDLDNTVRVLVLTGHDAESFGVQALEAGAASFLSKPVDPSHLLAIIRDGIQCAALRRRLRSLVREQDSLFRFDTFSTRNSAMRHTLEAAALAASHSQPVLIYGETGTGKGLLCGAIHRMSERCDRPFVRYQTSHTSNDLVASELFGHQRGAFTGASESRAGLLEEAHGGTMFIDELDELPPETQTLLLGALQEKAFRRVGSNRMLYSDFRLICATNRPPHESVQRRRLREDLFHRIAHFTIEIPPLRERMEDLEEMCRTFLREVAAKAKLHLDSISPAALKKLKSYHFPGNVRELQAVVEGSAYRARYRGSRIVGAEDIAVQRKAVPTVMSFRERVQEFERKLVLEALEQTEQNQSEAARVLGLDRSSLRRILERGAPHRQ